MFEYILQSWPIIVPIVLLSLVSVFLILDKARYCLSTRERRDNLFGDFAQHMMRRNYLFIKSELKKKNSPEARVFSKALDNLHRSEKEIQKIMEIESVYCMNLLEKNVSLLSGIANVATLLGLLGTVSGMIISFLNMKLFGISDPTILAGGISQALVTTAFGLGVAIPSIFGYSIFNRIIDNTESRLELLKAQILSYKAASSI
ncbi:MAG: MotA/TolQ/ExbB proton channel family protein [Spirochaetales bacterium]|nr:MotA/TolQ/ExbB proton channel family protein [Spirochaetales bacterium]